MDGIIINELSLNGQFLDSRDFWKNGMPPFHKALQDALSHGVGSVSYTHLTLPTT